jgi:hypothetical protein
MPSCLEFVKKMRLIDGVFTDTLLGSLNIIKVGNRMKRYALVGLVVLAAWLTHIVHCLMTAKYLLLIAGAFIAPVGVIHGVGLWFGATW